MGLEMPDEIVAEFARVDLFHFEGAGLKSIDEFSRSWMSGNPEIEGELPTIRALTLLAAAEYSLIPAILDTSKGRPFVVGKNEALLALLKCDTTPLYPVHVAAKNERRVSAYVSPIDLSVFSADIAKLFLINPEWWDKLASASALWEAVRELEASHRECPYPPLRLLGESALLQVQGLLWQLRLTVVGHVGFEESVPDVISSFVQGGGESLR
ncbi:hypothetical protein [Streptomyces sp. TRM49041]|uniref:hypothetical protein n=1 Tax=Streptomyces sp. TRM49041 TaxID=2603216 RepID=UPI0011ED7E8F|nr:hypothetical protein [Streptomyces sp. TRM49041]